MAKKDDFERWGNGERPPGLAIATDSSGFEHSQAGEFSPVFASFSEGSHKTVTTTGAG